MDIFLLSKKDVDSKTILHKNLSNMHTALCNMHIAQVSILQPTHTVGVKARIHFSSRDTEGNNKWLGQYPGNREGVRHPYHDCKCQCHDLSNPNPNCTHLTMEDIEFAKKEETRG